MPVTSENEGEAVLIVVVVVWLSRRPKLSLPGVAVRPLPDALLFEVVTSDPDHKKVSSCQAFQNELVCGISVDRGQMASFFAAKVLSCGPVLLLVAPEVAMVSVFLPTSVAGLNAFVVAAG